MGATGSSVWVYLRFMRAAGRLHDLAQPKRDASIINIDWSLIGQVSDQKNPPAPDPFPGSEAQRKLSSVRSGESYGASINPSIWMT